MTLRPYRFQFAAMTVPCEILLYEQSAQRAQQLAQLIHHNTCALERRYNFHNAGSWLSRTINQRTQNAIPLENLDYQLLQQVRTLSTATQGAFDITVGTLTLAAKHQPDKSRASLTSTLQQSMGLDSWWLDNGKLHFHDSHTCFDLGGVIKEYAVDQAIEIAQQAKGGCLISFGGDMRVIGRKPTGEPIKVGIKDPEDPQKILLAISVENVAITTSGNYERSTIMGGQEHEHILSNGTSTHQVISATVLMDSVLAAGAYSTALMINPQLALPAEADVILINQNKQIFSTL